MPWFVRRRWRRTLSWLVLMALLVWGWPQSLGGANAYVVLRSDSMRPTFKRGDLVVVRQAPVYRVGDAVLYRSPKVGLVFHRIVGVEPDGRFRLKGDANTYIDPERPRQEDILGRYVLHLPGLGLPFLRWGRTFASLLLVLALLWYAWPSGLPSRRKRWTRRGI